jgi:ribonuclease HII
MEFLMPWIVGIDEAGYGPNLGPFVMSAVALHVPESATGADPWDLLRDAVRRPGERSDARMLVADSKLIYSPGRGISALECVLHAFLTGAWGGAPLTLHDYLGRFCVRGQHELGAEPWYTGTTKLPATRPARNIQRRASLLTQASANQEITWGPLWSVVICSRRFNQLVQHWGSKGGVLGEALAELLARFGALEPSTDSISFLIDKHGGRNHYAAMLQEAMPEGLLVVHEERMERSVYSVLGLKREVRFTIQPRADFEHFAVALASMVSKYLRELLMREFNRFWRRRVRNLKPTAGYPGDSRRFFRAIKPTADRLGIPETALWRQK